MKLIVLNADIIIFTGDLFEEGAITSSLSSQAIDNFIKTKSYIS